MKENEGLYGYAPGTFFSADVPTRSSDSQELDLCDQNRNEIRPDFCDNSAPACRFDANRFPVLLYCSIANKMASTHHGKGMTTPKVKN